MGAIVHSLIADEATSGARIFMDEKGVRHAVPQHQLFLLRPPVFHMLSLTDWAMTTETVELPRAEDGTIMDAEAVEALYDHHLDEPQYRRYREANPVFRFSNICNPATKEHLCPLYNSHGQRLRSKIRVAMFVPPPPPLRGSRCSLSEAPDGYRASAENAAWYYLTAQRPYTMADLVAARSEFALGISFSYKAFTAFMKDCQLGSPDLTGRRDRRASPAPTIVQRYRHGYITSMSHGLEVTKGENRAQAAYRARNVKYWGDGIPDGTEPPPGRRRVRGGNDSDPLRDEDDANSGEVDADVAAARAAEASREAANAEALRDLERLARQAAGKLDKSEKHQAFIQHSVDAHASLMGDGGGDCDKSQEQVPSHSSTATGSRGHDNDSGLGHRGHDFDAAKYWLQHSAQSVEAVEGALKEAIPCEAAESHSQRADSQAVVAGSPAHCLSLPDDTELNESQRRAKSVILSKLREQDQAAAAGPQSDRTGSSPAVVLCHGGPGSGKSHFLRHLHRCGEAMGFDVVNFAPSASAATLLQNGNTVHGGAGISRPRRGQSPEELPAIGGAKSTEAS